jgi:4-hydroxy-4-methyl-2-oxoglutarate aldolase
VKPVLGGKGGRKTPSSTPRGVVVRHIERADPAIVAGLGETDVATVHEAAGQTGLLPPDIRPIQIGVTLVGTAVTVLCPPGDNMMVHAALEVIEPGDIMVIAVSEPTTAGMFGDLLATSAMAHGCRGLVSDASVRDVAELRSIGFPVWSRAIHAQGTVKQSPGSVNVPVEIGGQEIAPGDVVLADDDGVVVVERGRAAEVLAAAKKRIERELEVRERLGKGELGVDFYGYRGRLEELGVRWVDKSGDL